MHVLNLSKKCVRNNFVFYNKNSVGMGMPFAVILFLQHGYFTRKYLGRICIDLN